MRWLLVLLLSLSPLLAENRPWAAPEGFFTEEVIERKVLAPGLEWITASGKLGSFPLQTQVLSVDLSVYSLKPLIGTRLLPETAYFPRSQVSGLRVESGALAAINASFFDIRSSQSPLGLVMVDRQLLRSPEAKTHTLFFNAHRAALAEAVTFEAKLRVGEHQRPLDTVNASSLKGDQVGLYVSPWQRTPGAGFGKEEPILEIIVEESEWEPATAPGQSSHLRGRVSEVREGAPSRPLQKGEFVLAALSQESSFLRQAKAGDPVEIEWTLSNTPRDWTQWLHAIAGDRILFREGVWTPPQDKKNVRHPRTAVGINREGNRLLLVIVDGRSQRSVGAEINELGRYLHHLGAYEAINFDGGGSSAMSAIVDGKARLLNLHSDRTERFVPTGLGVFAP